MNEALVNPRVYRGRELKPLQAVLKNWDAARIFLLTGRSSYAASGAEGWLQPLLAGRSVERFSAYAPNPSWPDVQCALETFKRFKPDAVIAVGGGSAMDMAKLLKFFEKKQTVPLMAVPTTAGTGSEATSFAVLYKKGIKSSVESPELMPDAAVLNPELTYSLPQYVTACCGFDAFSQAVESYWAVQSTERSRRDSMRALALCLKHLENAVLHPSAESRNGMMEAAYLSGRAINAAKTTAAHALSYTLTAAYSLPHGHAVSMMLPEVFLLNAEVSPETLCDPRGMEYAQKIMQQLCSCFGLDSPVAVKQRILEMRNRIGLTSSWIEDQNVDFSVLCDEIVRGVNPARLKNNPCRLDSKRLMRIAKTLKDS